MKSLAEVRYPPPSKSTLAWMSRHFNCQAGAKTSSSGIGSNSNKHGSPHRAMGFGGGLLSKRHYDTLYIVSGKLIGDFEC